jgi:hypothetical protein
MFGCRDCVILVSHEILWVVVVDMKDIKFEYFSANMMRASKRRNFSVQSKKKKKEAVAAGGLYEKNVDTSK